MNNKLTWAKTEIDKMNKFPFKPITNSNYDLDDQDRGDDI